MSLRPPMRVSASQPTIEGAGVHLRRAFGFSEKNEFDPFLLFDDFRSDNPQDYLAGFPWHPHRGIETITYVLAGTVDHADSLGNSGTLGAGDVQWMTAGRGILHQEMPRGDAEGRMHGFQLWANLPASLKMTDPRYQDISSGEIPEVKDDDGTRTRVIWASAAFKCGPRDRWIGWHSTVAWQRLPLVANNVRFLILPGVRVPNLASHLLALCTKRLGAGWQQAIITSQSPKGASPADVLQHSRGHWSIENGSHWVRDVTFDEDRSQVRTGQGPRMMAILRNLAIAIIRLLGFRGIPTGLRTFAQRPRLVLNALGL